MKTIKNITLSMLMLLSVAGVNANVIEAVKASNVEVAKEFMLKWAQMPFSSLKKGYEYAHQLTSEVTMPEWAKKALAEQEIFSNKVTKIATAVTIASVVTGVVYKYDLHKKAYNGLVTLKNKVFGKPVQK